jgi:hypothetical protein
MGKENVMKTCRSHTKNYRFWHVPCSIATLTMGIYLALVCLFPSFNRDHHELLSHGMAFLLAPYLIFIMIGSPLFTLWYYSTLDDKVRERVSSYFHRDY